MIDQTLPHNLDIETSLLATCLVAGGEALSEVIDLVEPQYFYKKAHCIIFEAIQDVANEAESADIVSVAEIIASKGKLGQCGGVSYLSGILDAPIAVDIEFSCKKLEEKFLLRKTIERCFATIKKCSSEQDDFDGVVNYFVESSHAISDGSKAGDPVISMKTLSMAAADEYEKRYKEERIVTGIPTGITDLDMLMFGMHSGDLTLLGARPGMGKTATALNWAKFAAEHGHGSLIVSLEMPAQQLFDRLIAMETGINGANIRIGNFTPAEFQMVIDASGVIYNLPIYIDDRGGLEFTEVRKTIRRQVKIHPEIKVVYIDHLQLVRGKNPQNRNLEIGEISAGLKALAKELRIPIVALSQLNREVERRNNPYKRPKKSDLRDSGSLEQDADNIIFLYRPWEYGDNVSETDGKTEVSIEENDIEFIVSKQRQGSTGTIYGSFYKDCQRIVGNTQTSPDDLYKSERKKREKKNESNEKVRKNFGGIQK